jgi:hypothetical protein
LAISLRTKQKLSPHTRKARHDTKEHQDAQQPEEAGKLATVSDPLSHTPAKLATALDSINLLKF